MTDYEIVQRGAEAQALLQNALLNTAFANIRNEMIDALLAHGVRDVAGRELSWFMLKSADAVKLELEKYVAEAKMVEHKQAEEKKKADAEAEFDKDFERRTGVKPIKDGDIAE